nr:methyl-accepting chemotaxis protein [Treponema sp.]MBP3283844.1 methyl-accepting chemotaxis protein [Treponema sp.]
MQNRSLKTKLLIVLLSIVVVSNSLIGTASHFISKEEISAAVHENLSNVAAKTAAEIYSVNDINFNMLESLATQPFMKDPAVSSGEKNDAAMSIARRNLTKFKNVNYYDTDGNTVTLDGRRGNFSNEPFFREAMAGRRVVSDPVYDEKAGQTLMYYAVPVFNRHHVPQGVLAAIVFGDRLSQIVSVMQVGKDSHPVVLNMRTGAVIGQFSGSGAKVSLPDGSGGGELSHITALVRDGKKGGASYRDPASGKMMTCAYQPVGENCDWAVFCAAPYGDYFGGLSKLSFVIVGILAVSVALSVLLCVVMLSFSLKPLKRVKDSIHEIATGSADLTQRIEVETRDEIGSVVEGFNSFAEKLQSIIERIKDSNVALGQAGNELDYSTHDTASAITQIIANIESMNRQIAGQSRSVGQTAGAVNEIATSISSLEGMIQNQSSGVSQASAAVEQMIGNISSVGRSMEKMADSFASLHANAKAGFEKQGSVNEKIQMIEEQSRTLEEANKTIASIASQTNMLAMNAAIEAAHAGAAGRGFSVVADEIRKLSETSSQQSKTINSQLKEIRHSISDVVAASTESSGILSSVSEQIAETDQLVRQMKSAMEEQSEGSRQITDALRSMNDSTDEVRTASREMAEGNKMILREVKILQDSTQAMLGSMDEMSIGAEKINETGEYLKSISGNLKGTIKEIGEQIDQFVV